MAESDGNFTPKFQVFFNCSSNLSDKGESLKRLKKTNSKAAACAQGVSASPKNK